METQCDITDKTNKTSLIIHCGRVNVKLGNINSELIKKIPDELLKFSENRERFFSAIMLQLEDTSPWSEEWKIETEEAIKNNEYWLEISDCGIKDNIDSNINSKERYDKVLPFLESNKTLNYDLWLDNELRNNEELKGILTDGQIEKIIEGTKKIDNMLAMIYGLKIRITRGLMKIIVET